MKNSLRSYNKSHGLSIEVIYEPIEDGKVLVTCVNGVTKHTKTADLPNEAPLAVSNTLL